MRVCYAWMLALRYYCCLAEFEWEEKERWGSTGLGGESNTRLGLLKPAQQWYQISAEL